MHQYLAPRLSLVRSPVCGFARDFLFVCLGPLVGCSLVCLGLLCFGRRFACRCFLFARLSFRTLEWYRFVSLTKRQLSLRGPLLHPVSITIFPLIIFSPGAGLLRNPFVPR